MAARQVTLETKIVTTTSIEVSDDEEGLFKVSVAVDDDGDGSVLLINGEDGSYVEIDLDELEYVQGILTQAAAIRDRLNPHA